MHKQIAYSLDTINLVVDDLIVLMQQYKIFAFSGQMGTGKTTLIKAICMAKNIKNTNSPTFTIVNEYYFNEDKKTIPIYHLDLYRLKDKEEVLNLGLEEMFDNYCFIEWPEIAYSMLPKQSVYVNIKIDADINYRLLEYTIK